MGQNRLRQKLAISIHALLAESDVVGAIKFTTPMLFLSTLSLRRATKSNKLAEQKLVFLSTLSLRRATNSETQADPAKSISIHALLAESDRWNSTERPKESHFYPRSPCGERLDTIPETLVPRQFLSTLSLRRATTYRNNKTTQHAISIHALLAESDFWKKRWMKKLLLFLSTLSLRRATVVNNIILMPGEFLSTLSLRRATLNGLAIRWNTCISIHALLAESDIRTCQYFLAIFEFLSTLSLRRATTHPVTVFIRVIISIHALLAESDGVSFA